MFALDHLRMLSFSGPEARHFLQGQLTCDTERLAVGEWAWGGYLTPKGRLLSTFAALGLAEDRIGLLMDAGLVPATLAKLRMYLLRAKAAPEEHGMAWAGSLEDPGTPAEWTLAVDGDRISVGFGDGMALTTEEAYADGTARQEWLAHCARRGMPWIGPSLQEELTVHHASLDLIGGVDFDKGCYLGQEIVIRSHHRGAIKKRLYVAEGEGDPPAPGAQITSAAHGGQTVGNVLYAAAQQGGFVAAASIRKDAAEAASLAEGGAALRTQAPPYGLTDPKFESA